MILNEKKFRISLFSILRVFLVFQWHGHIKKFQSSFVKKNAWIVKHDRRFIKNYLNRGKKLNRAKNISVKSLSKICFVFLNKLSLNLAASQKNCICLLYSKTSFNVLWGISGWDNVDHVSHQKLFTFILLEISLNFHRKPFLLRI